MHFTTSAWGGGRRPSALHYKLTTAQEHTEDNREKERKVDKERDRKERMKEEKKAPPKRCFLWTRGVSGPVGGCSGGGRWRAPTGAGRPGPLLTPWPRPAPDAYRRNGNYSGPATARRKE